MFELFSDIFAYRDHALTRMDPRTKLILAAALIFSVILSSRPTLPLTVFVGALLGMLAIRTPVGLLAARLAAPMGIVLVLVVLQSLLIGSTPLWTITVAGLRVTLLTEGLLRGALIGARVLGSVSVVLFLSLVTPAHRIFHALRWCRVPHGWVETAMLMYRYTFLLLDEASDMAAAQRLRLGYCGLRRSLSTFGMLAGNVIIHSVDQASRTYDAMAARGYRGSTPFGEMPPLSGKDRAVLALVLPVVVGAYILLERGLL